MLSARKIVSELKPYPAPPEGRYSAVRLDFNENTSGFPEYYPGGIDPVMVSAYPEYGKFIEEAATVFGVSQNQLLATNGSDEALFLIPLVFVEPGDRAVLSKPCFAVMPQCLKLAGAVLDEVPVKDDFSFDLDELEKRMSGARIAMFASPENPTGAVIPPAVTEKWCKKYPDTLFVMDEAYGEYYGETALPLITKFDNLLVTRTFSKAWGMAGLRLGIVFGQEKLIDSIKRIKLPYTVNSLAMETAMKLLDNKEKIYTNARQTMKRKEAIENELESRGYSLVRGFANSFLLKLGCEESKAFEQFARAQGILVRPREEKYIRVSTGTEPEMQKFMNALAQFEKTMVMQK